MSSVSRQNRNTAREPNPVVPSMQARLQMLWPLRHDGRRSELRLLLSALQRVSA